jgi:hypothetical protein
MQAPQLIQFIHVAKMEKRNVFKILVGKPQGKRPLGSTRRRWENNIKTDVRVTGVEGVDWTHLAKDREQWRTLVNTVMNLRVAERAENFLTSSALACR